MQRSDFRFFERLRVRWAEIDAQQIVFNGHYLTYFDTAMAGYWRAMAMPYARRCSARRRHVRAQGDARIPRLGALRRRARRSACAARASATRRWSFVAGAFRQRRAARQRRADLRLRRSGDARRRCRCRRSCARCSRASRPASRWSTCASAAGASSRRRARPIRAAVFVDEQRIPADMEWDDADADAVHAVAFNRFGRPLGTGRMLEHVPGVAKIGRMAVAGAVAARRRRPRRARRADRRRALARRSRGGAARAARRRAVLRARRLRSPRARVRRGRHRPRRDAARALRRRRCAQRADRAVRRAVRPPRRPRRGARLDQAGERTRCCGDRRLDVGVDAGVDAVAGAQRVATPSTSRRSRLVAHEQPRLQARCTARERRCIAATAARASAARSRRTR